MPLRSALFLLPLLLLACTPPSVAPPSKPAPPELDIALLRREAGVLPGVAVSEGEPLNFTYPGETLFASGAVLPLPGGKALLDPLADFLQAHPEARWRGTVRAVTANSGEYDTALAQKRKELLERFFASRGVPAERLSLIAAAGEGAPLEFVLESGGQVRAASPASSSGANP